MALKQEMFRFVSTRRVERAVMARIASRLIRDRRRTTRGSLLFKLFGAGPYPAKLATANDFAASSDFLAPGDPAIAMLDRVAAFFRDKLAPGVALGDLLAAFAAAFPALAALLQRVPPPALLDASSAMVARLWDSFYAQTIRGCDRYVSTNYLADGLRVYHVFRLLWISAKLELERWAGVTFDEYDTLIDLEAARIVGGEGKNATPDPSLIPREAEALKSLTERLTRIDEANREVGRLLDARALRASGGKGARQAVFDSAAIEFLRAQPALASYDLDTTSGRELQAVLRRDRELVALERERAFGALADPDASHALEGPAGGPLAAHRQKPAPPASLAALSGAGAAFRVPLSVGAIKPPGVGDLQIVEQELRRYEEGELADIDTIMRGERRERTIRKLNRTSQTTTTETSFEQEESSSLKRDERFQLSSQAQQAAEQSFGVQAGVNVSGKFGPVQVSASVNASFDTSKSSSDSTAQEYAKTVTEEATKRVKNSIKQTSSITVLSETQDTTLRGLNNEEGTAHVNGLYRWVDKIYEAQLVNYGRRLMLSLNVPAPAAFYRTLIQQNAAEALADLEEPLHPSRLGVVRVEPLPASNTSDGFLSFEDIDEDNYAKLAALYDVSVPAPPPEFLTGSKGFVHPEAMQAKEITEHDYVNDLSYVSSDNTLTVDPGYRLTHLSVFAPKGSAGGFDSYVDALKLGEDGKGDENIVLVQVGNQSFYLTAAKSDNGKAVVTNFNTWKEIEEIDDSYGGLVQPALPVTITSLFEGILTFTVLYKAIRTAEAYAAWQSSSYAAIIKGYNTKKQAYEQAKAVAESKAQSTTEAATLTLRDDQYRSIEVTELKRGCIDLLSAGTAAGHTSIKVDPADGMPHIVHDPAEGATIDNWRPALANGSVAEFFELTFEWENIVYQFHPYYWAGANRWKDLAQASSADLLFEQFLRAGNASVVVPVRPGYERPAIFFLKTGLVWGGGYLSLFTSQDMLDVYEDVELGRQFDPPLEIGDPWEIRVPTSMVILQSSDQLPVFPPEEAEAEEASRVEEPVPDETVPF
jgi:hypothetical protein